MSFVVIILIVVVVCLIVVIVGQDEEIRGNGEIIASLEFKVVKKNREIDQIKKGHERYKARVMSAAKGLEWDD